MPLNCTAQSDQRPIIHSGRVQKEAVDEAAGRLNGKDVAHVPGQL